MNQQKFSNEDLTTKDAIWVVIFDINWKILIQDHVKLDFFTIPIGKVWSWENPDEVMKREIFDETWLTVFDYKKLIIKEWVYDYNWVEVKIRNHIYEILSWSWNLVNKEPNKHRSMKFMTIEEVRKLTRISDATRIFLSTLK